MFELSDDWICLFVVVAASGAFHILGRKPANKWKKENKTEIKRCEYSPIYSKRVEFLQTVKTLLKHC